VAVGSVQQAVLEFDESVSAPWRPSLRSVSGDRPAERARRAPSAPRLVASGARAGRAPAPLAPPSRRDPVAPAGRAPASAATAGGRVRGGCAVPARREVPPLRLTRRARRLLAVLGLVVAVALGSVVGSLLSGGPGGDLRLAGVSTVVVEPGDTLWSIASSVAGTEDDVRAVVYEIQQLNRLEGPVVVPGQVLQLP
jgi:nucleoid-associated protein YgaU